MGLAGELAEILDHDRSGRHVHPERQRLGGEDHLHQTVRERLLDRFLEGWDHAGVVARDPVLQGAEPAFVPQHLEIAAREGRGVAGRDLPDAPGVGGVGQSHTGLHDGADRLVAAGPAEDEHDGRQHVLVGETFDDGNPLRGVPPSSWSPSPPSAVAGAPVAAMLVEPLPFGIGLAVDQRGQKVVALGRAITDQVQVAQLDRTLVLDDEVGGSAHHGDPLGQLLGVGDRRRQAHQPHRSGQVHDDLFPHRSPVGVLEVVDLVEHHVVELVQPLGAGVEHVAQHFGGHDDDRSVGGDDVVAGHQTDGVVAVPGTEVAELLIGECLDRCRVERPRLALEGPFDRMFGDDGLSRAGRGGDDHRVPPVEALDRPQLEAVELEVAGHAPTAARWRRRSRSLPMWIEAS